MRRNNLILLLLLVAVAGLSYMVYKFGNSDKENTQPALCDMDQYKMGNLFPVEDTGSVDMIVITDTRGQKAHLKRNGRYWTFQSEIYSEENGWEMGKIYRAADHKVNLLLKCFFRIELKEHVRENAKENMVKRTMVDHKKVDIYQKGKLHKTWYVGGPTADHYGTYMLLELPDCGISKTVYIMKERQFNGTMWPKFFVEEKEWRYSGIWEMDPTLLSSVQVTTHDEMSRSFTLQLADDNRTFTLLDGNSQNMGVFDTASARSYYTNFRKIHFEKFDDQLTEAQRDSLLTQAPPYYTFKTVAKNGDELTLVTYRKKVPEGTTDMAGIPIDWDADKLFAVTEEGDILVVQYWTFNSLFKTIDIFKPVTPS